MPTVQNSEKTWLRKAVNNSEKEDRESNMANKTARGWPQPQDAGKNTPLP